MAEVVLTDNREYFLHPVTAQFFRVTCGGEPPGRFGTGIDEPQRSFVKRLPRCVWQPLCQPLHRKHSRVTFIAAEKFITTITGNCDRDLGPDQARDQQGRDLGRIGKWFVENFLQLTNSAERRVRVNRQFGVMRSDIRGKFCRIGCLVEFAFRKADRKGLCATTELFLHDGANKTGIHPAREEGPDGDV